MYRTMIRKQLCSGTLLVCLVLTSVAASGLEKTIEMGKESLWADMLSLDGVTAVPGRWGFRDLVLTGGAYALESATELLLHFDSRGATDATGTYAFIGNGPAISNSISAVGGASAVFTDDRQGIRLGGAPGSMFSAGAAWGDFAIEFWLYPANLADGENILSWNGSDHGGSARDASLVPQGIVCFIRDRRLVWDFKNVFKLPGAGRLPVMLTSTRQILPRAWHHHLLRFNSREGLLEYLVDGMPEAIAHVTGHRERDRLDCGSPAGHGVLGRSRAGRRFHRVHGRAAHLPRAVDDPVLSRFLGKTGTVTTRIIDLGYSSTRIARNETVTTIPADSGIEFSYQTADTWGGRKSLKSDTDWVPFVPGTDFADALKARYIQLRVEMYPDGTRTKSPRLSSLRVVYEQNLPPAPPAGLVVTAGNGKVTLTWRKVNDLNLKGYLVFYGTSPHNYLGTGAAQGDSPIDAGSATTLEIGGLENGSLYYFTVAAYDTSDPRQQSEFSTEISARPSRMYK